jgi:hypothetical protein
MSDEKTTGSGWTNPPKGRVKKLKKPPKNPNSTRRGAKHTVQRRQNAEKIFSELQELIRQRELAAMIDPPLVDANDYILSEEPVPEMTPNEKRGAGGTYREEYARIAQGMCELGATDLQVARALNVSLSTMWGWQARHEDFFRAMILGKDLPDEKVVRALYQRAVGYSYPEVEFKVVNKEVRVLAKMTHLPPDTGACVAFLRSRRKEWNPAANLQLGGDQMFMQLWQMVAQGQTAPMIDITPEPADAV